VLTPSPAARDAASSFVALSDVDARRRDILPGKQTVGCSEGSPFSAVFSHSAFSFDFV
jgi:hypothetical protein